MMATTSLVRCGQGEAVARDADTILVLLSSFKEVFKHLPCTGTKGGPAG